MGLDTSHNCWHGPYTIFNEWRNMIARTAGLSVDWYSITDDNLWGEWKSTPKEPLMILIAHSDCEGVIHPDQAGPLADRLEQLLDKLPSVSNAEFWRYKTQRFIDGLRLAVENSENVDFH